MSEHHPDDVTFGDVLPEQTSDDIEHPSERDAPEADVQRLLDDRPPHHLG